MRTALIFLLSLFISSSCISQNWDLIWSDEFNGTSLNPEFWTHERGNGFVNGLSGWGNGELQYYQEENATVANGELTIQVRHEPQGIADEFTNFVPYYYSSSRIITQNKFEFLYGKVEARIKTMDGQGLWPAFWMLPGGCWPETGEIDIMEQWGNDGPTNVTTGAAHLGNCGGGSTYTVNSQTISSGSYADEYHVYSVIWSENSIAWYVDDILFHSVTPQSYPSNLNWPFNENDWFLILNLAITSGGPNGNTPFPNAIKVDYVRVYQDPIGIYDVTFRVDVSDLGLSPQDAIYLNGTFNGWCGLCNPMVNEGNGIWSTTLPLTAGQYEYKFTLNGWNSQEVFVGGEECTLTTGEFVNRVIQVADNTVIPTVCWEGCQMCNAFGNVTFQVDMNDYTDPFSLVNLSSNFNGWCGDCNPMMDSDGDGVYSTTVSLPFGAYEYKFSLDNWIVAESFQPGAPCTNTTNIFTNRIITIDGSMTLPNVCWNSCSACPAPVCQAPHSLDVMEIGFGGSSPRVNATWVNPEGTTNCEVRGGRISDASAGTSAPVFQNSGNTRILNQTNGSTVNFNIALYNNPNIPFVTGKTYGYEARCQCSSSSDFSVWSGIQPSSTFIVPALPAGVIGQTKWSEMGIMHLEVYPNPSHGILNFKIQLEKEDVIEMRLRNSLGQIVHQERWKGDAIQETLSLDGLESGIYILEMMTSIGVLSERIMIE